VKTASDWPSPRAYSAQIVFFGAAFTKSYSRRLGMVVAPAPTAVPLTADARAAPGMDGKTLLSFSTPAARRHGGGRRSHRRA
jgi:hypothetical protein